MKFLSTCVYSLSMTRKTIEYKPNILDWIKIC